MEGDDEAYCSDPEKLQEGRLQLPAQAAPGIAELGLRQPEVLTGYNTGVESAEKAFAIVHLPFPIFHYRNPDGKWEMGYGK